MSMPQTLASMIPMHLRRMVKRLENGMVSQKLQAVFIQSTITPGGNMISSGRIKVQMPTIRSG